MSGSGVYQEGGLAALAMDEQGSVASVVVEVVDVGSECFGDPQQIQGEQAGQGDPDFLFLADQYRADGRNDRIQC